MSNRFASCGPAERSAQQSVTTKVGKPCWTESTTEARTHPEVVAPSTSTLSAWLATSSAFRGCRRRRRRRSWRRPARCRSGPVAHRFRPRVSRRSVESISGVPDLDDHYRKQRIPYGLHGIRCLGHLRLYRIGHGLSRLFPEGKPGSTDLLGGLSACERENARLVRVNWTYHSSNLPEKKGISQMVRLKPLPAGRAQTEFSIVGDVTLISHVFGTIHF